MRVKPSDVTAAFRVAVLAAKAAGVIDTETWTLYREGAHYSIIRRGPAGNHSPVLPGYGHIGATHKAAFDALHNMRAAWELVPGPGTFGVWPCWHVKASNGLLYGVAATTRHGALSMVNARLAADSDTGHAVSAEKVDTWEAEYGNVLCYGDA